MNKDEPPSRQRTPPRTDIALQGARIAGSFRGAFAETKLGEHIPDMSEPEETTGHGERALQHVTLKTPGGLALVVGTVNCVTRKAELHSYPFVAGVHEERFKKALDFDAVTYLAFLDKARVVLGDLGIEVSVTGASPMGASVTAAASPSRGPLIMALLGGLAIGGLIVWLVLR